MDTLFFLLILSCCNLHLLFPMEYHQLMFFPKSAFSGEWYRFLTFSFVHGSWYHLLLDAGAFLILYTGLTEKNIWHKLFIVLSCGFFSLMIPLLFSAEIYSIGLCGLSGIAHGLMAVSGLEMMQEKFQFNIGFASLFIVIGKSCYEAVTGTIMFSFLHIPLYGTPIAICHAGGVIGGVVSYVLLRLLKHGRNRSLIFIN